ncbi:60S ribosomal subunit assembly/export protein [Ophidiomyces ophidiicola]|uniref:60S ribosomal subunit assembly/export protein n=1 Tax=Ophidiomyces ophidiicola TaxID=1387563 RepID=A0ACB8UQ14_9EURO|nr:60S ribosomal subunit assembly/export protein [Ophidiomyces ophidiicola]KAI1912194.1 60S ribosomal subunit assembly/export protein [Ophidiomyces ophidiicola]KAI1934715.1 60S ribosomal subunit assembly/export protein [Ophidiomyces ophidiicola]KAI1950718.1 60S ribosomal subunit assembly/export protein [Ophidiomyces ophidiicola]KAI1951095.1 60S ribosomal subunit assembly/export protein [Ophidiomyces ophidiicola]KAI1968560.1 60S ribosomal subunit assembly/export protein [Ophidiomyces ophidiicol
MSPNRGPSASKQSNKAPSKKSSSSAVASKSRVSKKTATSKSPVKRDAKRTPFKEVKTKARTERALQKKKKQRKYTEKELNIPALNMITPVGVQKPRGAKKGKIFVDDQESMMTILAMVNAEKDGEIESKIIKARRMEEIREARKQEAEARQEEKKSKLEQTKESLKRKRNSKKSAKASTSQQGDDLPESKSKKKQVSFV